VARLDVGLLLLRSLGAYLALGHGWGKLVRLSSGDAGRFVEAVAKLGFPLPEAFAWAAAAAEFAGGLLIALGLGTRIAASIAAISMAVAAFGQHRAFDHFLVYLGQKQVPEATLTAWGNPELAFCYLVACLAVALAGPGRIAVDSLLRRGANTSRRR
jgi:putative oxidoreductase